MIEQDKKIFWPMINLTMELCNRPALSKEAIISYWHVLKDFDLADVRNAVDEWVDNNSKSPTPNDLKELCKNKLKSKVGYSVAIPHKRNQEVSKEGLDKIAKVIQDHIQPKTDYKAWAKRIMQNPHNFPEYSVKCAKEALGMNHD